MRDNDLRFFNDWFSDFCKTFYLDDEKEQRNITLKEEHTHYVCENSAEIARGELPGENELLLAETVALFHDSGRFPQYARYKTFRDSISVNHGILGAKTLTERGILDRLDGKERDIVINTVKFHNCFVIPEFDDPDKVLFLKLVRDADKLDIWRVFIEFYESPEEEKAEAVGLGLPDVPGYSGDLLAAIRNREVVSLRRLKTLNDFKLLQLSWIFDLNFKTSLALLLERDYIKRIAATLPPTEEISDTVSLLSSVVKEKIGIG